MDDSGEPGSWEKDDLGVTGSSLIWPFLRPTPY